MNDQPILTDARIEAMLARRAGRGSPGGLAEAIRSAVSESGQVGRPLWTYLLPPSRQAPTLRLAWVIALIGLLLAAAVSVALVGGELLRRSDELTVALPVPSNAPSVVPDTIARHPVALQPTGVIEATGRRLLSLAGTSGLAVGPDGETWALGSGRLLRIDASGDIREWTLVDDAAFGSAQGLSPSQFGGVWLFDGRALRRFDGSIFTDVVETPLSGSTGTYLTDALEAPDGQLWVTAAKGVFRWDGASWTALPWPFDALPGEIGFDRDGRPWVGLYEYPGPYGLGVAMYDETAWTEYSPEAVPLHGAGSYDDPQGGEVVTNVTRSITSSSDGSVWFATEGGLARFDGVTWSEEHPFGPARTTVSSVSVAPDGTVWAASSGSAGPGSARAARRDGSVWQELDLPADMEDFGGWAVVAATGDGVVFASDGGVLRLAGNEWARAWPAAPPTGPGYVSALVAASADEVLAGSASWDGGPAAVWTFRRGTWERDTSPGAPNQSIRSLALGADGSLWAGGEGGLQVKRGEKWSSVIGADPGESVWQVLPLADGTVWVTVSAFEPDKAGLVALRPDGSTWRREEIGGSPLQWLQSVAVTRDGSVWVGSSGGWGPATPGLARYDGQAWTIEHPLGAPPPEGNSLRVGPLLSASDGSLWVAGEEWPTEDPGEVPPRFFVARFSDGEWTVSLEVDWPMSSLAEHPDGSILAAGSGVWTFRDGRWSEELAGQFLDRLSIAPDGSVWASGNDVYRIR